VECTFKGRGEEGKREGKRGRLEEVQGCARPV